MAFTVALGVIPPAWDIPSRSDWELSILRRRQSETGDLRLPWTQLADWARGDLRDLMSLYAFSNFEVVRDFILRNDGAADLLLEAYPHLMGAFTSAAQLVLRVEQDPDEDASDELLVGIRTGRPIDDALADLALFDEIWWREASSRLPMLNFDVE
jgi:hypothetical protein